MSSSRELTVAEACSQSILNDRCIIWWRELQPFCLDHWEILQALKSPLLFGGEVKNLDLQLAIVACSTGNNLEFYDFTLRPHFGQRLWFRLTRKLDVAPALKAFEAYMAGHAPAIARKHFEGESSAEGKTPTLWFNAARWVAAGHDPVRVRRMGLGELNAWNLAMAERDGDELNSLMDPATVEGLRLRDQIEGGQA